MNLKRLHEEFIEISRRPMQLGKIPISPKNIDVPIVVMNKWETSKNPRRLSKTYKFRRLSDKTAFVNELLEYEEKVKHNADIFMSEDIVRIELVTKDVQQITELDKEYAKFSDETYKEIVISKTSKKDD